MNHLHLISSKGSPSVYGKRGTLLDLGLDTDEFGIDGRADELTVEIIFIEEDTLLGFLLPSAFLT